MFTQKLKMTSIIAALAIVAVTMVLSMSLVPSSTALTTPPQGNNVYIFAEGVNPQVTFTFREGQEIVDFQLFDMTSGIFSTGANSAFTKPTLQAPEFSLIKVVGNTPLLHRAVDQVYENGGKYTIVDYPYREFDATVNLNQAGSPQKTFSYKDCSIVNYKVNTRTDNEEGYTTGGKTGFAVVETYNIQCAGMQMSSPDYDSMIKEANKLPFEK
jgi:hypothetical protein